MKRRSYDDDDQDDRYEQEEIGDKEGDDAQADMLAELEALVELGSLSVLPSKRLQPDNAKFSGARRALSGRTPSGSGVARTRLAARLKPNALKSASEA